MHPHENQWQRSKAHSRFTERISESACPSNSTSPRKNTGRRVALHSTRYPPQHTTHTAVHCLPLCIGAWRPCDIDSRRRRVRANSRSAGGRVCRTCCLLAMCPPHSSGLWPVTDSLWRPVIKPAIDRGAREGRLRYLQLIDRHGALRTTTGSTDPLTQRTSTTTRPSPLSPPAPARPRESRSRAGASGRARHKPQDSAPNEGPPKKKSTDPPVHLLNPRPTHPPADFSPPFLF
jgi:hypothetical protein